MQCFVLIVGTIYNKIKKTSCEVFYFTFLPQFSQNSEFGFNFFPQPRQNLYTVFVLLAFISSPIGPLGDTFTVGSY